MIKIVMKICMIICDGHGANDDDNDHNHHNAQSVADHMIERRRNKQEDFCLETSKATKMDHALSLLLDRP